MRCNDIVIGKIPETVPEWMEDEEGIINNGLWVYDINDIPDVLAKAIGSWMRSELPKELTTEMEKTNQRYTSEEWDKNVENLFKTIIDENINNFEEVKKAIKENNQ